MQFFITLGLLTAAAAAYLVYQYRSRDLARPGAGDAAAEDEAEPARRAA